MQNVPIKPLSPESGKRMQIDMIIIGAGHNAAQTILRRS